jgi:ribosomal protein S18 acetylase RimI-like enzyme
MVMAAEHSSGNPYNRFDALSADTRQTLFLSDLEKLKQSALWSENYHRACICLNRLSWDSEQLKVDAGRVDLFRTDHLSLETREEIANSLRAAVRETGLRYVRARIVEDDAASIDILRRAGFQPKGHLLNMALSDMNSISMEINPRISVRPALEGDESSVRDIASESYENSLLNEPGLLPGRVHSLYGNWAINNLRGRVPLALVAVNLTDARIAGFFFGGASSIRLSDNLPVGFVDLIVVRRDSRQRGIGRTLMFEAIRRMLHQGIQLVELNVADNNESAIDLYAALGFHRRLRYLDLTLWSD